MSNVPRTRSGSLRNSSGVGGHETPSSSPSQGEHLPRAMSPQVIAEISMAAQDAADLSARFDHLARLTSPGMFSARGDEEDSRHEGTNPQGDDFASEPHQVTGLNESPIHSSSSPVRTDGPPPIPVPEMGGEDDDIGNIIVQDPSNYSLVKVLRKIFTGSQPVPTSLPPGTPSGSALPGGTKNDDRTSHNIMTSNHDNVSGSRARERRNPLVQSEHGTSMESGEKSSNVQETGSGNVIEGHKRNLPGHHGASVPEPEFLRRALGASARPRINAQGIISSATRQAQEQEHVRSNDHESFSHDYSYAHQTAHDPGHGSPKEIHGGGAKSFVQRIGNNRQSLHTSIRNDGSSGSRMDRYPPGFVMQHEGRFDAPTSQDRGHGGNMLNHGRASMGDEGMRQSQEEIFHPVPERARGDVGPITSRGDGGAGGNFTPTPMGASRVPPPEPIRPEGAMARQILKLNELYLGFFKNRRIESKLAKLEAKLIHDLYLDDQDMVSSDDGSEMSFSDCQPPSYGTKAAQQGAGSQPARPWVPSRTTLETVQTNLKQTRKMKSTLQIEMTRFIIKEFNMSGTEKEYKKSLALTKFTWPSGIVGVGNLEAAHQLRAELHKLFTVYCQTLATVLPMYDEMSGITRGFADGQPRYVPPDSSLGATYIGSSRVPYFDKEFKKANEALFEVLEQAPGGYKIVRSYFGKRSYGSTVSNRTMVHGRDKDGLSILCSILVHHESTTFSTKQALRTKLGYSHGLFAKGSIPRAIATTRRLIEQGHLHKIKLDYNVIATIAGTLCSRNGMFIHYLSKWMEARPGISEHDALGVFDEFLCEIDQVNQKIAVIIPNAVTQESTRAMHVLRLDQGSDTDFGHWESDSSSDESELSTTDPISAYSTYQPSGFRDKRGGRDEGKFAKRNPNKGGSSLPHRGGSSAAAYPKTMTSKGVCGAKGCTAKHLDSMKSNGRNWLCKPCYCKMIDAGKIDLKNGEVRRPYKGDSSSFRPSNQSSKFHKTKAYAVKSRQSRKTTSTTCKIDDKINEIPSKSDSIVNHANLFVGGTNPGNTPSGGAFSKVRTKPRHIRCGKVYIVHNGKKPPTSPKHTKAAQSRRKADQHNPTKGCAAKAKSKRSTTIESDCHRTITRTVTTKSRRCHTVTREYPNGIQSASFQTSPRAKGPNLKPNRKTIKAVGNKKWPKGGKQSTRRNSVKPSPIPRLHTTSVPYRTYHPEDKGGARQRANQKRKGNGGSKPKIYNAKMASGSLGDIEKMTSRKSTPLSCPDFQPRHTVPPRKARGQSFPISHRKGDVRLQEKGMGISLEQLYRYYHPRLEPELPLGRKERSKKDAEREAQDEYFQLVHRAEVNLKARLKAITSDMPRRHVKCHKVYINRNKTAPAPIGAVLTHGHTRAPRQYLHFKAVVDTGCDSTLFRGNVGDLLHETSKSTITVGGFEGDKTVGGGIRGVAHCYAISNDPNRPGAYFKHVVDTVEGLNDNLFSIHGLTNEQGYQCILSASSDQQSGLHRKATPDEPAHTIPMTFNTRKQGFRIELVVAKTREAAIRWGQHEEKTKFQTSSKTSQGFGDKLAKVLPTPNTGGVGSNSACSVRPIKTPLLVQPSRSQYPPALGNVSLTNKPRSRTEWTNTAKAVGKSVGGPILAHNCSPDGHRSVKLCTHATHSYDVSSHIPRLTIRGYCTRSETVKPKDSTSSKKTDCETGRIYVESTIGALMKAHRVLDRRDDTNLVKCRDVTSISSDVMLRDDELSVPPEPTLPSEVSRGVDEENEPNTSHENMISGAKAGLKSREKRLTQLALHKRHGHLGHSPGCLICKMVRGSMRRVFTKVDPHVETRPGYTWACDMATWSHASQQGNQYCIVMRDVASGYFVALHAHARSDALELIREWILNARKEPMFARLGFPIVQSLRLDKAGEWGIKNKAWMAMTKALSIRPEWTSPDDKRSAAHAENAVKQVEVVAKSILLENNLPYIFIEHAVNQGVILRNLYPLARNVNSQDGDTIRPLEEISGGLISRRMCDNRIHHLIPLGTPCIVHVPKVKGTRIDKLKSRWGISIGMEGDLPEFFCPFDNTMSITFHSKNYFECAMPDGWNYYTLLGIKGLPTAGDAKGNPIFPIEHEDDTKLHCLIDISKFVGQRVQRITSPHTPEDRDGADPDGLLSPQITLIDKSGTIYHQIDGEFKPTDKSIGKEFANVHGTSDPEKRRQVKLMKAISEHPKSLTGMVFYKNYPAFGCYQGRIRSYNRKDKLWRISWEDGMKDDMDADDLIKYLVHKIDDHLREDMDSNGIDVEMEDEDLSSEREALDESPKPPDTLNMPHPMVPSPSTPLAKKRRKTQSQRKRLGKLRRQNGPQDNTTSAEGSPAAKPRGGGARVESRPTQARGKSIFDIGIEDKGCKLDSLMHDNDSDECEQSSDEEIEPSLPSWFQDREFQVALEWFTVNRGTRLTYFKLCDAMRIDPKYRQAYYKWLGPTFGPRGTPYDGKNRTGSPHFGCIFSDPWGVGRNSFIKERTKFPIPIGVTWNKFKLKRDREDDTHNPQHVGSRAVNSAFNHEVTRAYLVTKITRNIIDDPLMIENNYAYLSKPGTSEAKLAPYETSKTRQEQIQRILEDESMNNEESGIVDPRTGKLIPPKSFKTMLSRADRAEWAKATLRELDSLDSLGVLDHDHTLADIRKRGIKHSPVPMMLIYDAKYKPDGSFDKFKARDVVCGHKGFMRQGEHFTTTFSAAPSLVTTRLLQVLHVALGLKRKAWDIATAYLWAPCRENEKIPIRYPLGLRRYHKKTGEELYAILMKNCYGMPQADRRYSQLRDAFIMERFNQDGWSVKKARMDPCLFIFQSPTKRTTYVSIHTDDCEGVGDNFEDLNFIADEFHKRFKIKIGDPRFMLGIKREVSESNGVTFMTMTQPDFVITTFNQHKHLLSKGVPETPFPAGSFMHLAQSEDDPKVHKKFIDMGYMNIVGSLLWGARNCYPEMLYGVTQCCRLMSKPDPQAWASACHMLQYMNSQLTRGIRFRSDGNESPICYYDSSNKADPTDGKSQWGYCIYMFNGPIDWGCKKHNHVGLSSHHNEYMALSHATKSVVFLRQLLVEMGLGRFVKEATPVLGDNDCTTNLSREDLVSPGNKFFLIDYHFCKEQLESGAISTRRVGTKENLSDLFTKASSREEIRRLRDGLTGYGDLLPLPAPPPED